MAVFTPKRLVGPHFLTTTAATQFTVGTGKQTTVKQFVFNNTSTSTVAVTAHVVGSGGSAATSNQIITELAIGPKSQIIWSADIPMVEAETVQMLAGTDNAITVTISGIEIA